MANKVVTLYIDDGSIRLLVTRGRTIKKYASLVLEAGMVEGALVVKEADVAQKVKQLLKSQKVRGKKVVVGLSALNCMTRPVILPQLPKAMLAEAVLREAKRVLPLALEQFYITWNSVPAPRGKMQVFLAAVRCQGADALLRTLHQAGLKPSSLDLKPLALSGLVRENTAVILDVQPAEFDIVILSDGVPQPIRTLPFPSDTHSWQEKLPIIKAELDRTMQFFNTNSPENPLTPGVRIYVSGELAAQPEPLESLSKELGYPVAQLTTPLKCIRDIDYNYYMVNIGLALRESSLQRAAGPSVATSNLLPLAYRPKPFSWSRVVVLPAALVIVGALVPLFMLSQSTSANITSVRDQLDAANKVVQQKTLQKQQLNKDITALEKQLAQAATSRDTLLQAVDSLGQQRSQLNQNLDEIVSALPEGMTLKGINQKTGKMTVSGLAKDKEGILAYAKDLLASDRFSEVVVARMADNAKTGVDFILNLKTKD